MQVGTRAARAKKCLFTRPASLLLCCGVGVRARDCRGWFGCRSRKLEPRSADPVGPGTTCDNGVRDSCRVVVTSLSRQRIYIFLYRVVFHMLSLLHY